VPVLDAVAYALEAGTRVLARTGAEQDDAQGHESTEHVGNVHSGQQEEAIGVETAAQHVTLRRNQIEPIGRLKNHEQDGKARSEPQTALHRAFAVGPYRREGVLEAPRQGGQGRGA
jgi:hypothetical protein